MAEERRFDEESERRLHDHGLFDLLRNSINVLGKEGQGRISNKDAYPGAKSNLRLEYSLNPSTGEGYIEVGVCGEEDGKGYREVLRVGLEVEEYHYGGEWEEDLAKRIGKA